MSNTTIYDEVPYPGRPHPQTHPDRMATLALWHGMTPAPVKHCRVLELACGDGGNLLPMAATLPESWFVGFDLSPSAIATAQATVKALGLTNVDLGVANLLDVPPGFGPFDYIIAHGLYSWVPPRVQDKVFAICKQSLAPGGVAYVSFNAYPGWHGRQTVREMLLHHVRGVHSAQERASRSRAFVAHLAECSLVKKPGYRTLLAMEARNVAEMADALLYHDLLEDYNQPRYLHEFVDHAAAHGLRFLAEASFEPLGLLLSAQTRATLEKLAGDAVECEQYLDFVINRTFRRSLLCHADVAVDRTIRPERLALFRIAGEFSWVSSNPDLTSARQEEFRHSSGQILSVTHPLTKSAFLCLAAAWPQSLPFEELKDRALARLAPGPVVREAAGLDGDIRQLAQELAQASSQQLVELHLHQPEMASEPGERPVAPPLARLQAKSQMWVTNLCHRPVGLDALARHLLSYLDGSRDREALLDILMRYVREKGLVVEQNGRALAEEVQSRGALAEGFEASLRSLARMALLVR